VQSARSFDFFLSAILLVISATQMMHGLDWATLLFVLLAAISLLIIRRVIGAGTTKEAFSWMRFHEHTAFYLLFLWVATAVLLGYSVWMGYAGLIEATALYFFAATVYSAIVLLGHVVLKFFLNLLGSRK
jgi:hypothetical protein